MNRSCSVVREKSSNAWRIINRRFPPFCVIKLIKRTLFLQQDFEWPVGRFAEDIVYSVVTAYQAKKIEHLATPFYHYRCDGKSLTHVEDEESLMSNYQGNMSNVDIIALDKEVEIQTSLV